VTCPKSSLRPAPVRNPRGIEKAAFRRHPRTLGPAACAITSTPRIGNHARISWLISPKGRGTSHLTCRGERERSQGRPKHFRTSEAKNFARAKLVDTPNVTAGTLNPRLPKRTIAAKQILEWLEQADDLE
jgi:hypothetical protein